MSNEKTETVPETQETNLVPERNAGETDAEYLGRVDTAAENETQTNDNDNEQNTEPASTEENVQEGHEEADKIEKTPIPDEIRAKIKIPEKFKSIEDMLMWGSEAEKKIGILVRENAENKKSAEIYKEEYSKLQKKLEDKVDSGTITEEAKEKAIEDFRLEWEVDPLNALKKVLVSVQPKKETEPATSMTDEEIRKEQFEQFDTDFRELISGISPQEQKELISGFKEISKQFPNVTSLAALNYIRLGKKQEIEKKLAAEEAAKKKEKAAGSFPAGITNAKKDPPASQEVRVRSTESLAELEKLEKELSDE
jgi:hypothetical protein